MLGRQLVRFISCASAAIISTCFAVAQPVQISQVPTNPQPSSPVNVVQPTQSAQMWNLKDADIRAVIQTISILTGKNFIVDPRVNGKVTLMSQKPMTPDEMYQVFLSMLQLLQYAAIPSGDVIKIVPAMDANAMSSQLATHANPGQGDEIVVRVVPINHVSATELVSVLRPLMTQSGSVTAYLPSNTLILAGTAGNIERLVRIIHQMDSVSSSQISIVHLRYASAQKVVSVIQKLQNGNTSQGNTGHVILAADDEDNTILVNANETNQVLMRNLIHQIDQKGASLDETRVVILNYLTAKKIAPVLAKIAEGISATQSGGKGKAAPATGGAATGDENNSISIQSEDNNNAIIMHGSAKMLDNLTRVIHRLDGRPQEVLVEAIIVQVDESLLNKLGIVWGVPDNSTTGAAAGSATITKHNIFPFRANPRGIGLLPSGNLTALLHLFKSSGSSDVLSTPSIVVLNNQKASIDDGKNVGMANQSYSSTVVPATNSIITPSQQIERRDVTLSLDVTPHVSPNNMIRLALKQQNDALEIGAGTGGVDNPTIDTSKIVTSVLVKSGDILVLGGLINNTQQKTVEKVPILGDLPLLGHLFRYNSHQLEKKSLMVFIRPVIMSKESAIHQTLHRYAYVRQQQINMETEHPPQIKIRTLPSLAKPTVQLPQPVSTFQLPMPSTTITGGTVH